MGAVSPKHVTELLVEWGRGDRGALDAMVPLVYDELRRMAHRYLRQESRRHNLQSTSLVHEAFVRMVDQKDVHWRNRTHFFAIAAQLMRRILVDRARSRRAAKRGGGALMLELHEADAASEQPNVDLIALDDALNELAKLDGRLAKIVELRFFAGLSLEETSAALAISPATVKRDWVMAKAWLHRKISKAEVSGP